VIIRRERPHPGAQLKFTDHEGHRFQATLTDLTGDMVEIERLHRGRGDAENLIRGAKQTGLENLPFREFDLNAVWVELSLIAQDLIAWTQRLCLEGELANLRTQSAALPLNPPDVTPLPDSHRQRQVSNARCWAIPRVGGRRWRSAADCCFQRGACGRTDQS
jgi:Transposase DDE domain group 1